MTNEIKTDSKGRKFFTKDGITSHFCEHGAHWVPGPEQKIIAGETRCASCARRSPFLPTPRIGR